MKVKYLYFFLYCFSILSCTTSSRLQKTLDISVNNNSISIFTEGSIRAIGGLPNFQSTIFEVKKISLTNADSVYKISFSSKNSQQPVMLKVHPRGKSSLCFSLSPNGNQSPSGKDFLGLFFEEFPNYKQGIATFLFGDWKAWTKPLQVRDYHHTKKKDLLFFLWQYEDGTYGAAMPLAGKGYAGTLGSEGSRFGVKSLNYLDNTQEQNIPLLAMSFGENPYLVVEELYYHGMTFMGKENNLRINKIYPSMFEKIGWCTWNSIGEDITEKKMMEAVSTFTSKEFRLPWLLIDDGWLTINDSLKLMSMEADPTKFKRGLEPVVTELKQKHGIEQIGLWHTLNGYWNGVDSKSRLLENYKEDLSPYIDKYNVHDDSLSRDVYWAPSVHKRQGDKIL